LNYWKAQATAFNHFCIKYHKNPLIQFPIYPQDISFIIRSTINTTQLQIQNTNGKPNLTQSGILQASDTFKIPKPQQQHFIISKLYNSHKTKPHTNIHTHVFLYHDTQITNILAQVDISYANKTKLISTAKISHRSLASLYGKGHPGLPLTPKFPHLSTNVSAPQSGTKPSSLLPAT